MGIKFRTKEARDAYRRHLEAPPSVLGLSGMYDRPRHTFTSNPAPDPSLQIRARYLPKEKRWLVLVDSENPFVTEHASLAEAMRRAGAMAEAK